MAVASNPMHTLYTFFNLYYWDCSEKRPLRKEKEAGIGPFFKKECTTEIPLVFAVRGLTCFFKDLQIERERERERERDFFVS